MTDSPSLEERVAALEARLAPFQVTYSAWPALTEEETAELKEQIAALQQEPLMHRVIHLPPPLTPEQVRQLLRECVTVVKPGETLVVRVGFDITPMQVRELQDAADGMCEYRGLPFKVLVFPGDELAVTEQP